MLPAVSELLINGRTVRVDAHDIDPHTTVLEFLRDRGLVGTKEGCAEGECGACAVALVRAGADGKTQLVAINSCLTLLGAVLEGELITVEGVRPSADTLHPVQAAMVEQGGSQCGYCTPGFVISMFAEYYRRDRSGWDPESVAGNLCRCTGYRPIRDAMRSLGKPAADDPIVRRLAEPAPPLYGLTQLRLRHDESRRLLRRPASLAELMRAIEERPDAKLVAGGTDVVVEINQRHARWPNLISLDGVDELRTLDIGDTWIEIGAGVTLSDLEHRLAHAVPLLDELFPLFSSRLIRNRATLGGNLANASPIGDSPPVLLALGAELELLSRAGVRTLGLDQFFLGYRKTALAPGEVLTKIRVPTRRPTHAHFYKVSKRVLDDISTVAAAFALTLDDAGAITDAKLAYGGVAATPMRATAAEQALIGKRWDAAIVDALAPTLVDAFTPMTDHRGSADYRRHMCATLFQKFFHETQTGRRIGPQPP